MYIMIANTTIAQISPFMPAPFAAGFPASLVDHLLAQPDPTTWSREDHDKAFLRVKGSRHRHIARQTRYPGHLQADSALPHRRLARIQHLSPHNLTDRAALRKGVALFLRRIDEFWKGERHDLFGLLHGAS